MTVSSTTNRIDYTGNGISTVFPYPLYIFAATDLLVYVARVPKLLGADYSVTNAGNLGGGNVVFTSAPNGTVTILRTIGITQTSDYVPNDPFPADTLEGNLDRLTMICQQLNEALGRALVLSPTSLFKNLTIDDLVAGRILRVKSDLTGIEMADPSSVTVITNPVTTVGSDVSAHSADIGATVLATPSSAGLYRISGSISTKQAATTSSTLPSLIVSWTDADSGQAMAYILAPQDTTNAVTAIQGGSLLIRAQASTTITYSTSGYASSGAASLLFNLHVRLEGAL